MASLSSPSPLPHAPTSSPARRLVGTLSAVLVLLLLTGCGLRLETDVPKPLVPGANELARQAMVNDLVLIQSDIATALMWDGFTPEQVSILERIALLNAGYEELLGGVYDSGLPQEEPTPSPPSPTEITTIQGPQDAIDRLLASCGRVRATLPIVEDPDLARLFASMSISNLLLAQNLAKESDLEFVVPPFLSEPVPETVLAGIPTEISAALIRNEDSAGYGFEVIAAMRVPERRAVSLSQAQFHRDTAKFWAQTALVADTVDDPRRVAYELPFNLTDKDAVAPEDDLVKLAQDLEITLTTNYIDLIAHATADNRPFFFEAAIRSALIGVDWGVRTEELPFFTGAQEFLDASAGSVQD